MCPGFVFNVVGVCVCVCIVSQINYNQLVCVNIINVAKNSQLLTFFVNKPCFHQ